MVNEEINLENFKTYFLGTACIVMYVACLVRYTTCIMMYVACLVRYTTWCCPQIHGIKSTQI